MNAATKFLGAAILAVAAAASAVHAPPAFKDGEVRDAKVLDNVEAGDKMRFRAINDGGKFTITELEPGR